ncbi:MBL fold metallo-hydrolase [Acetatifactor muris]|uniref:Beta-lactamase superfamily domain protein n=1 Tax=Acetatifactor muris TaxID=879566 RepID=A0A2K4ZIR3_9FIRM|nr:MBL fold metallo-hydrolase [Acetatifactor muris]MCR2048579.1 MBL fold metallo-hydrolase [Acetatifactor muris]SOY30369.1 Beta-lactamase superfamily domain protein [Acetatifactor muris]
MNARQNKITIYRGSHQIGGCATEISTGKHRIIIDFGANLPDNDNEDVMTDEELTETVFGGRPCDGVLFTHYHGDHIGLYKKVPQNVPLYIGSTAKKILEILTEKIDSIPNMAEEGLPRIKNMECYSPGHKMIFGDIGITPFFVDHSALDAYMFLLEVGGKKILFTGDFREHGIVGRNDRLERMVQKYIGEVDILISEGTMLSRTKETNKNPIQTEDDLGNRARELFQENKESVILVSSTNLDSIMKFYHAVPWGMDFVCDAYQAKLMLAAMADKGNYHEYRREFIHGKPRRLYIIGDMEGLGAEQNCCRADFSILKNKGFTMLVRENKQVFKAIMEKYMTDPLVIYSKWIGYLKGKHANAKIGDFIGSHRMEILHTSGHAYVETIEKLIRLTNPKTIIPMHTECADAFGEIAEFAPYRDRITVLQDKEEYSF